MPLSYKHGYTPYGKAIANELEAVLTDIPSFSVVELTKLHDNVDAAIENDRRGLKPLLARCTDALVVHLEQKQEPTAADIQTICKAYGGLYETTLPIKPRAELEKLARDLYERLPLWGKAEHLMPFLPEGEDLFDVFTGLEDRVMGNSDEGRLSDRQLRAGGYAGVYNDTCEVLDTLAEMSPHAVKAMQVPARVMLSDFCATLATAWEIGTYYAQQVGRCYCLLQGMNPPEVVGLQPQKAVPGRKVQSKSMPRV